MRISHVSHLAQRVSPSTAHLEHEDLRVLITERGGRALLGARWCGAGLSGKGLAEYMFQTLGTLWFLSQPLNSGPGAQEQPQTVCKQIDVVLLSWGCFHLSTLNIEFHIILQVTTCSSFSKKVTGRTK